MVCFDEQTQSGVDLTRAKLNGKFTFCLKSVLLKYLYT